MSMDNSGCLRGWVSDRLLVPSARFCVPRADVAKLWGNDGRGASVGWARMKRSIFWSE